MAYDKQTMIDTCYAKLVEKYEANGLLDSANFEGGAGGADYAQAKLALELIAEAAMETVTEEGLDKADVSTTVASGIAVNVDPNTGTGATSGTGSGSGGLA